MPNSKKHFLYIFPSNFEHSGITVKVKGQVAAFEKWFSVQLLHIRFSKNDAFASRLFAVLSFQISALYSSFFSSVIYMRYNPKTPIIHIWLGVLSFFKTIYIEHNTLLENELLFLGRKFENRIHCFLMWFLKFTPTLHVSVNNELKNHLHTRFNIKPRYSIYVQNGFLMPSINDQLVDKSLIKSLISKASPSQKIAVFCGNGYPWHGLSEILELCKATPTMFLIIVGPYTGLTLPANAILAGKLSTDTLYTLYESCHFAISTFRWDMLNIHEGSPLKTREYLSFGLPILVHYYDCASDFELLTPYIFNIEKDSQALEKLLASTINKEELKTLAQNYLSWESLWSPVFNT